MTSYERREVAATMRVISGEGVHDLTLGEVLNSILTNGAPRPTTEMAILVRLADLIDPTCEVDSVEPIEYGEFNVFRLTCGHGVMRPREDMPPAYCEECGARVVTHDEHE